MSESDTNKPSKVVVKPKGRRYGFASMSEEKRRAIASKGGKAAHAAGTAHEVTSEEARAMGKLGGIAVSRDHDHMAEIGRIGGKKSRGGGRPKRTEQGAASSE